MKKFWLLTPSSFRQARRYRLSVRACRKIMLQSFTSNGPAHSLMFGGGMAGKPMGSTNMHGSAVSAQTQTFEDKGFFLAATHSDHKIDLINVPLTPPLIRFLVQWASVQGFVVEDSGRSRPFSELGIVLPGRYALHYDAAGQPWLTKVSPSRTVHEIETPFALRPGFRLFHFRERFLSLLDKSGCAMFPNCDFVSASPEGANAYRSQLVWMDTVNDLAAVQSYLKAISNHMLTFFDQVNEGRLLRSSTPRAFDVQQLKEWQELVGSYQEWCQIL